MEPAELAELFFAENTPEAASAVFRALSEDSLFFKRKGVQFLARTADQVSTELTRRQRQRDTRSFANERTPSLPSWSNANRPPFRPRPNRSSTAFKTGCDTRPAMKPGSFSKKSPARQGAGCRLRHSGARRRIDPSLDRFLVIAGVETEFSPALLEAAGHLEPYFILTPASLEKIIERYRHSRLTTKIRGKSMTH